MSASILRTQMQRKKRFEKMHKDSIKSLQSALSNTEGTKHIILEGEFFYLCPGMYSTVAERWCTSSKVF
jgi:hypothetical protein